MCEKFEISDMDVPDKEELVLLESWVRVDDKYVKKDRWITKAQQASMAEELESEERLVYNPGCIPNG